jgi:uncharacterized protein
MISRVRSIPGVLIWTLLLVLGPARVCFSVAATELAELQSAAAGGDADAQYALGDAYYFGTGVSIDANAARKWYARAEKHGHAAARFSAALINGNTHPKDAKLALASIQRDAELGSAIAQWKVGMAHSTGTGVRRSETKALEWFTKAAEQHLADAEYSMGYAYQEGLGVARNYAVAVTWMRRAAEQGAALAQFSLGHKYEYGRGVPQDYAEAAKWYRLAADQGDAVAQFNLGVFYEEGHGFARDAVEAVRWYRLSADQAYDRALLNLGAAYLEGVGVDRNYSDALLYFRLAAGASNDPAVKGRAANGINDAKRQLDKAQIKDVQRRLEEWIDAYNRRTLPPSE